MLKIIMNKELSKLIKLQVNFNYNKKYIQKLLYYIESRNKRIMSEHIQKYNN